MNKKPNRKKVWKADLHLHTNYSDGFNSVEELVNKAVAENFQVIAITDHNLISSAILAQKLVKEKKLPLEIIVGEEISTCDGEIIGLFLKEKIPYSLSAEETIAEIKKQNGLVIIPHSNRILSGFSLSFSKIDQLRKNGLIDAIEIYNFWDLDPKIATRRQRRNLIWQTAEVGGSDSHHTSTIGSIFTLFPGKTANDLKTAIKKGQTLPINKAPMLKRYFYLTKHGLEIIFSGNPFKHCDYPDGNKKDFKYMLKLILER